MGAVPGSLNQRPEAFNRVGVEPAIQVGVLFLVIHDGVRYEGVHRAVAVILVRHQDGVVQVNSTLEEPHNGLPAEPFRYLSNHFSAPLDHTQDSGLLRAPTTAARRVVVLAVRATWLASDVGFVGFDNALEEIVRSGHGGPNPVLDVPGGLWGQLEVTGELVAAEALLGVQGEANGVVRANVRTRADQRFFMELIQEITTATEVAKDPGFVMDTLPPGVLAEVAVSQEWVGAVALKTDFLSLIEKMPVQD